MTKDEAIELARAAGVVDGPKILMMATPDELHRFAQAAFKLGRNAGLEEAEHKYEIETLRAQLAALQSDDELPEPAVGFDYDYYEGLIRYEAPVPRFCETSYYTADQLRQAQAMVRAKMVPLEKDAARYLRLRDYLISDRVDCDDAIVDALTTEELDAAVDALPDGITGEPK